MMITNVMITSQDPDSTSTSWDQGLVVDGSQCVSEVSGGVRTISIRKLRVTNCTTAEKSIEFISARHIFASGVEVDPGPFSTIAHGITFSGINDGIFFESCEVYGVVKIVANNSTNFTRNFHLTGRISTLFHCLDDAVEGTVRLSGLDEDPTLHTYDLISKSPRLKIVTHCVPTVLCTMNAAQTGLTGDGTTADVKYDKKRSDTCGNYNTSTGEFTCTVAGVYDISYSYLLSSVTTSYTRLDTSIKHIKSAGGTTTYTSAKNPGYLAIPAGVSGAGLLEVTQRLVLELKYGDKIKLTVMVNGGSKFIGIYGYNSDSSIVAWLNINYIS